MSRESLHAEDGAKFAPKLAAVSVIQAGTDGGPTLFPEPVGVTDQDVDSILF